MTRELPTLHGGSERLRPLAAADVDPLAGVIAQPEVGRDGLLMDLLAHELT